MYPVRGRIVRVTNPGLTMSVRDEEHPGGRAYVHPRAQDCILGGTLEKGEWDTAVDPVAGAAIVERCCDLAPALRGAQVLEQVVGLRRPGRPLRGGRGYRCRGTARCTTMATAVA